MAGVVKGDVVVVPFPFSDLSKSKRRPALVIATLEGNDVILCQITSKSIKDSYSIILSEDDFASGGLMQTSNVRPNRVFTADNKLILYKVGALKTNILNTIIERLIYIIRN